MSMAMQGEINTLKAAVAEIVARLDAIEDTPVDFKPPYEVKRSFQSFIVIDSMDMKVSSHSTKAEAEAAAYELNNPVGEAA